MSAAVNVRPRLSAEAARKWVRESCDKRGRVWRENGLRWVVTRPGLTDGPSTTAGRQWLAFGVARVVAKGAE